MEIITAKKLQSLSVEYQRQFEGLLPELVKRLIINSCESIDSIRIPNGEDIWAPGFDGIVYCSEQNEYINSGNSIWEFGTSKNSLKKINEDYEKRTKNSLGIEKKETIFYLVIPKIWVYPTSITKWENDHNDWEKTKVYDASVLCDWINNVPVVAAWLLEEIFKQHVDFTTVEEAWSYFSQKTDPRMTTSLFLSDRKGEQETFYNLIQKSIIRVKADTLVEAQGFVLSALKEKRQYFSTGIVVNNEVTYRLIASLVRNKLIVLNYSCNHDFVEENSNKTVVCYNKEDTGINDILRLSPLPKYHYIRAFTDMGISNGNAEELYTFSHGNLRSLIRRIPGLVNDTKPEWVGIENSDLLTPLLFLRRINRSSDTDRLLVEMLAGDSFDNVERHYQELIRLEDTPIKVIDGYYILINYEETWYSLGYTVNGKQYAQLTKTILAILDSFGKYGKFGDYRVSEYGRFATLHNLLMNYIYFSFDDPFSRTLHETIGRILDYLYKPNVSKQLIHHLSILAEAAPSVVVQFLNADFSRVDNFITPIFLSGKYDDRYTEILFCLDELTRHAESAVLACRILFKLYQGGYEYRITNSPEDSLVTALCFINQSVALCLNKKVELIKQLYNEDPARMGDLIIRIIDKDSYCISERPGKKKKEQHEEISVADYYHSIEDISSNVFINAIDNGDISRIKAFIDMYRRYMPEFIANGAAVIKPCRFSPEALTELNYHIRKKKYDIQRYRLDRESAYLEAFSAWIVVTTVDQLPYHWLFHRYYDCPDDRLVEEKGDYFEREQKKTDIRKDALDIIVSEKGNGGVVQLIMQMEDTLSWGRFLADNLPSEFTMLAVQQSLESKKISILAGVLDTAPKSIFSSVHALVPSENRGQLYINMQRSDIDDLLKSSDEKRQYWYGKSIFQYNEAIYKKLLEYYPVGLLPYCHNVIKSDPKSHLDMVFEIVSAIRSMGYSFSSDSRMEDYEFKEILNCIDKSCYSEEWGELCKSLYVEGTLMELTEGVCRYFFYHPQELIAYLNTHLDRYYYISNHYLLPTCAYSDMEKMISFSRSLVLSEQSGLLGEILGRSIPGGDGCFPHECIRNVLEQLDNVSVDRGVIIGFYNSRGARMVTDGTDMKRKSEEYFEMAGKMEISFPHTSSILRNIALDYLNESHRDYLYSEIDCP